MFYKKKRVIIEEAPAGVDGLWVDAKSMITNEPYLQFSVGDLSSIWPKDYVLIREHGVCTVCGGNGIGAEGYQPGHIEMLPCDHCLIDEEYGSPTGAEPGTAGPWKVKKK